MTGPSIINASQTGGLVIWQKQRHVPRNAQVLFTTIVMSTLQYYSYIAFAETKKFTNRWAI